MKTEKNRFKGLTKRKYKKRYGSSTPGSEKSNTCKTSGREKGLTIYPRAYKTMSKEYNSLMKKQNKQGKFGKDSLFN